MDLTFYDLAREQDFVLRMYETQIKQNLEIADRLVKEAGEIALKRHQLMMKMKSNLDDSHSDERKA